jgi:hypothetical protein
VRSPRPVKSPSTGCRSQRPEPYRLPLVSGLIDSLANTPESWILTRAAVRSRLTAPSITSCRPGRRDRVRFGSRASAELRPAKVDPVTPNGQGNVIRRFTAALKRASLSEKIRFHDLRHANATALVWAGIHAKAVSALVTSGRGDEYQPPGTEPNQGPVSRWVSGETSSDAASRDGGALPDR